MEKKNKIGAILFDLDGVLIDSFHFWFHLFNDTLEHFGHKRISLDTFRRQWGKSTEDDIKNFMPERSIKEVKSYFYSNIHRYADYMRINHQAILVLKTLSKKYSLGCVSNSHTRILDWQVQRFGLKEYFQATISADDVKRPKPAPEMLLKACRELKVKPINTIFIGDTKTDIIAGKKAGCIVIGYRVNSRLRINNLKELLKIIKE